MSFLRKLFGSSKVPAWASFMSYEQFNRFQLVFQEALTERFPSATVSWDQGMWKTDEDGGRVGGLVNIAQLCRASEGDWSEVCRDFLAKATQEATVPESLEEARSNIKIRLQPLDMPISEEMVLFPVSDQFQTMLVYDLPDSTVSLKLETLQQWDLSIQEAFSLALDNVWAQDRGSFEPIALGESAQGKFMEGPSFFISTNLLLLDRHFPEPPEHGLLAIAPIRHLLLVHEIRDEQVVEALGGLSRMAHGAFRDGPGSITPSLFWWRNGELRRLPIELRRGQLHFDVPEDFQQLLESLV